MKNILVAVVVGGMMLPVFGKLELGVPFADGVVLQRNRAIPVWGKATPGRKVTVAFAGSEVSAVACAKGRWMVMLPEMAASKESRTLTVTECEKGWLWDDETDCVELKDVLVGEVWFCAGQSNTELPLCGGNPHFRDGKGAMRAQLTRKPCVRFCFQSNYKTSTEPKRTAPLPVVWKTFTPENLLKGSSFSAMGVYFALELYSALDIPIGIVGTYFGGTRIEPWTPASGFETVASLKGVATQPIFDSAAYKVQKDAGKVKFTIQDQPRVLWNEMVNPWTPFAIRGFIWYQGCSNAYDGLAYADKMQALYNGWAKEFANPDLKLYFVQLAPWGFADIATIQEGQAKFAAAEKNASMAVISDCGCLTDIHPNDKETVGQRLALLALKRDYGFDIKADSPTLRRSGIEGDMFVLEFNDVESWYLYNPDWTLETAFEICGADGVWKPAKIVNAHNQDNVGKAYKCTGTIDGKVLKVRAEGVAAPKRLRYLHSRPWKGCLYNEVNLPLGAFETN